MAIKSPVSHRSTVAGLLLLTFATGLADAISVLVLGHVFVANMTGNVIFFGFWFAPRSTVDLTAVVVAFPFFVAGTILGGRLMRHLGDRTRRWVTTALGIEVAMLVTLSILAGAGICHYHDSSKLFLIGGMAVAYGLQHSTARQFGISELTTTVLTSTIVGLGVDSRLAGGRGERAALRVSVVVVMCLGAIVGATITRVAVAPVLGLAAAVVGTSLVIFRFGKSVEGEPAG